jgi:integral membrane protein
VLSRLFPVYRVLAIVVGILLTILVFVGMPLKYLTTDGSSLQSFGDQVTALVGVTHGFLYMAYLVVAFLLWRLTRWPIPFAVLVLAAGVLPILIFFIEHEVTRRVRADHPELAPTPG